MLSIQIPLLQRQLPYNSKKKPGEFRAPPVKKIECNIFKLIKIMQKTKTTQKFKIERSKFSYETWAIISDFFFFDDKPFGRELKSDLVKLALYSTSEDFPDRNFYFYIQWLNDFTDKLMENVSAKPTEDEFKFSIPDSAIEMIQLLFEPDPLYVKSDLLNLFERVEMITDGYNRNEKGGPLILIKTLNELIDSVYNDMKKSKTG
jgi:hypothetical protein